MIRHMFVFGVLLPTFITIIIFVGFLVCWFKFNIKDRVVKSRFFMKHFAKAAPTQDLEVMQSSALNREVSGPGWSGDIEHRDDPSAPPATADKGGATKGRLLQSSDYVIDDRMSVCSFEGSQTTLCKPAGARWNTAQTSQNFIVNPNWQGGDSRFFNQRPDNGLVQQTYHFPELKQSSDAGFPQSRLTFSGNSDNTNYGHFLPPSQVTLEAHSEAHQKFLAMTRTGSPINKQCHLSAPHQPAWNEKLAAVYRKQQSMMGSDHPLAAANLHCATSVSQDRPYKFRFPKDIQPTLIPGM